VAHPSPNVAPSLESIHLCSFKNEILYKTDALSDQYKINSWKIGNVNHPSISNTSIMAIIAQFMHRKELKMYSFYP